MRIFLAAIFTIFALPVWALSCLPQDLNRTFQEAAQSEDSFVIVVGKVTFDAKRLPVSKFGDQRAPKPNTLIPARINGQALNHDGFGVPFTRDITLNVQCYGPWCGSMSSGQQYLAFLRKAKGRYQLDTNPCGGFAIGYPTKKQLEQVKTCFRGGACHPKKY